MTIIKSPLRYPGGKARALRKILPLIPKGFSEYREPFLGGGSVFIAFKQQNPNTLCRINDFNRDVYCFWKTMKKNPNGLIDAITQIKKVSRDGKSLHAKLAHAKTSGMFGRALRFYILNRISYSGTVDSGGYSSEAFEKRFTLSKIEKLRPLANLLRKVEITNESYESLLFKEGKNVFIFLDPPYWKTRNSRLYGKNGNLSITFNHQQFAENVKKCEHKWLITCDDSTFVRELFSFAYIYPWEMRYGMNKKQIKGKELFITNYEPQHVQMKLTTPKLEFTRNRKTLVWNSIWSIHKASKV
jgi:DNA adenine methylase